MSFLISACHGRRSVWSLELQNIWCDWLSAVNAALTEGEMNEVERWNVWNGDDTSWLECTINNVVLLSYVISWGHILPVLSLWFIEQNVTLIEQEKTCKCLVNKHILDYGSPTEYFTLPVICSKKTTKRHSFLFDVFICRSSALWQWADIPCSDNQWHCIVLRVMWYSWILEMATGNQKLANITNSSCFLTIVLLTGL